MSEIESLVDSVQKYFLYKIIMGEYECTKFESNYTKLVIDGKYEFTLWTGSGANYLSLWNTGFISLPEFTPKEKEVIWAKVSQILAENAEKIKKEKIAQLKADLERLENT